MSEEEFVRRSALKCVHAWKQTDASLPHEHPSLHPESSVLLVDEASGEYTSCPGTVFSLGSCMAKNNCSDKDDDNTTATVASVKILPVGDQNAAACHVKVVGNDNNNKAAAIVAGFLVLLRTSEEEEESSNRKWQCISAAFSSSSRKICCSSYGTRVVPEDMNDVIKLVWDGYCAANRACNGARMAQVFHPTCRLTYAVTNGNHTDHHDDGVHHSGNAVVHIKDQVEFCNMVTHRYDAPASNPHHAYRHLLEEKSLVSQGDSMQAVEFATPCIALVTLRVGHPPFLWTDLLTVAKISSSEERGTNNTTNGLAAQQNQQQWWIVHKSSCSEPFLIELRRDDA